MEAQAVGCSKIAKLQVQYLGEQKYWNATIQNLNNESALTIDKMAPVVKFIERLCTHLKDQFPEDNRLCNWCIFEYSCINQANFNFGRNKLQQLLKQFSYFFHCYGPGHKSDTPNQWSPNYGPLRFFIRPAELFLKNTYTHFEPQLDRIILGTPQFQVFILFFSLEDTPRF